MRATATLVAGAAAAFYARPASAAEAARRASEERAGRAAQDRDRLRQELVRRREFIERLERSRRAERNWNQELRAQLQRAYASRGALAADTDVRELVLRAAIELVGARKGLLLSRRDSDSDGDLDLVSAHGFEHDPEHGALVQRFAREVLARDRTLREDAPGNDGSPADAEIENLVAIPMYLMDRFQGVVICANRDGGFEHLDDDVLLALGDHAGAALHMQRLHDQINHAHRAAMRMLAAALEARDPLLRRQAGEAALLARTLCRQLGLSEPEHEVVATATLLRDVGHVAVPERILLKPGPLSVEERSVVQLHPRIGFTLVNEMPALHDVATAVLYHHERVDGSGYPMGLAGEAIPLAARVIAVVDAYSAIVHDRPHRRARTPEQALAELGAAAGTQFDTQIVEAFSEVVAAGTTPPPELADAVASALDTAGLARAREDAMGADPLTQLPGHRAFHEAAHSAVAGRAGLTVAMVQLEGLEEVNREHGYGAGDRAIVAAARAAQLAALRVGGTVYRISGRRLGIVVAGERPELAGELHTEFGLGPPVHIGVATPRGGETAEDVIRRARGSLGMAVLTEPPPPGA